MVLSPKPVVIGDVDKRLFSNPLGQEKSSLRSRLVEVRVNNLTELLDGIEAPDKIKRYHCRFCCAILSPRTV